MPIKQTSGFGLIEVLIAVAMIAGLGFLVSEFVLSSSVKQVDIRSSSACQTKLNGALAKIKESDNNSKIDSWIPKSNELQPGNMNDTLTIQLKHDIVEGYDGSPLGEVLSLSPAISINPPYTNEERQSASLFNNYQLISSATSIIAQTFPEACASKIDAADLPTGPLRTILEEELGGLGGVQIQVQRYSMAGEVVSCDPTWRPVPLNTNANASITNDYLLRLSLTAEFEDESNPGENKTCTANANFSPGSDLVAPTVSAVITPLAGLTETAPGSGIFCGPNGTTGSFQVQIQQTSIEPGVQYLCRLDYVRGNLATITTRYNGTGWFVCSMPEASINGVETTIGNASSRLSVSNVVIPADNQSLSFRINNATEGSYRLHVKAVDVARNESPTLVRDIRIDLNRPALLNTFSPPFPNSTVTGLEGYHFQCGPGRNHSAWITQSSGVWVSGGSPVITESVEVTSPIVRQRYVNFTTNAASFSANFSCNDADVNLGANVWAADGPKLAQIVVCDACNAGTGDTTRDLNAFLWYVDTAANLAPQPASISASRMQYDAGNNDGNPYVLSHQQMVAVGHTLSSINPAVNSSFVRNSYDANRNVTGAVMFPPQPIGDCHSYGHYSYTATDGCNRPQVSWSGQYAGSNMGGLGANPLYCPNFDVAAGSPSSCAPMIDCDVDTSGGYSGNRSGSFAASNCSYDPTKHRACATPTCPSLYTLLNASSPYPYKCSTCNGSTEVIVQPVELGGGSVASLPNGCPGCSEPPCLNYARCYALRKCLTGNAAEDGVRDVSAIGPGGGTTACGVSYSYLACSLTEPDYYVRFLSLNQDPLPDPVSLFPEADSRVACACSNGATNYPNCNICASGYTYNSTTSQCEMSATPTPTPDPTASPTPDPTATATPTPTPTPTATPGGGGGCFIAGTPVVMANGSLKAIEEIEAGDLVVSMNEETGTLRPDVVTEVVHHEAKLQFLYDVTLEDGTHFTVNGVHPMFDAVSGKYMFMRNVNAAWLEKKDVKLYGMNAKALEITSIEYSYQFVPVYNFHVKGSVGSPSFSERVGHNYFVDGILVHNGNGREVLSPAQCEGQGCETQKN